MSSYINLRLLLLCQILFSVAIGFTCCNFIDFTENTELIQQRSGSDVRLQCNLKGLIDERKLAEIKIHWYFRQCEDNCYTFEHNDWTPLPCEGSFCKSELWLRNVTEKYSGLYKCTIFPYSVDAEHSFDIQLVRTYQLDVKNTSLSAPEFLDSYPLNKTATADTQVVFQCRVHSEEYPTIKWFRRIPQTSQGMDYIRTGSENFSAHIVRYNGRTYELLKTGPERLVSTQIYLSKLILNGVRLRDEGFYACVAISFRGHKIREAYLQVVPVEETEYWIDYDEEIIESSVNATDPRKFWLLFLMPLGLASLPLIVWLCYMCYKRCTSTGSVQDPCRRMEQQYSDEELDTEHCILSK